jgi:ADP-ribose pyrophosphatase
VLFIGERVKKVKFLGVKKGEKGKFITRYNVQYETNDGQIKNYEMISRNPDIDSFEKLHGKQADAVVIIATDENDERILINREFRLAPGEWVYNFPAGLIDPGERPEESAVRELMEETGLELYEINDFINTSYSAVGFSNETNVCVVGRARGEFKPSTSAVEEIEAGWYTKDEIRELIKTEKFAARTQAFCYMWSKNTSKENK